MKTYCHALEPMLFEYAIQFADGLYYTGRVSSDARPNYDRGNKSDAFTYTREGAYNRLQSQSGYWNNAQVVRIA
jgi:hypothetical protein